MNRRRICAGSFHPQKILRKEALSVRGILCSSIEKQDGSVIEYVAGGKAMVGEERRREIINLLRQSSEPVPARKLAELFDVSRQVIVQDIALLRAAGDDILSTSRGYILNLSGLKRRVFKVCHTDEQTADELLSIVDLGGTVLDVFVWHKVYGRIEGELNIDSRRKVDAFIEDLNSGRSQLLKNVTSSYHYHTVEARDEDTLDLIQDMLQSKGYLAEGN